MMRFSTVYDDNDAAAVAGRVVRTETDTTTNTNINNDIRNIHIESPSHCSNDEIHIIQTYQLPLNDCKQSFIRPWSNKCSFSYATRCPDAIWLSDQYTTTATTMTTTTATRTTSSTLLPATINDDKDDDHNAMKQPQHHSTRIAIYVGCNKGMDAINTLRMLSQNATFDRDVWRAAFLGSDTRNDTNTNDTTNNTPIHHEAGRCGQEFTEQFPLLSLSDDITTPRVVYNTIVHCIEAMPSTANHLQRTAEQLRWTSSSSSTEPKQRQQQQQQHQPQQQLLLIHNVAMSNTDGTILFPNVNDTIGIENQGFDECKEIDGTDNHNPNCVPVPLYRLDTFMSQYMTVTPPTSSSATDDDTQLIDFLSIDVEGYDYEVILGAPLVLQRTKYIEFEYNWKGNWNQHLLSDVIDRLHNNNNNKDNNNSAAGFVCYWAGTHGHIWRITNCWMEHYKLHFWSNIACVNIVHAPQLYHRMEEMFHRTVRAGDRIQYNNVSTANTDGGYH